MSNVIFYNIGANESLKQYLKYYSVLFTFQGMEIESLYSLIAMPLLFFVTILYFASLLFIANKFRGIAKTLLSLISYIVFALCLIFPLLYLIHAFREQINASAPYIFIITMVYGIIIFPSLWYLFKYKKKTLQNAGYFLKK